MAGEPTLAKAWIGLVPTLKGSQAQIQKELGDIPMDEAGKKGGKKYAAALGIGIAAAGALIVKGISASIEQASDLNESVNAVSVSFGKASDGVLELGKNAASAIGLSNADFNSLAVQMSAFTSTIAGDGGDVVGTLDDLTTRASDFASVMNLEVADAAAIFQSGLAGESEPLRKYGIDLSAAAVEAYALSNGIWDGAGAMTEAQKVQARYGSLMDQTVKTQGDFANTSDQAANAQRIFSANLANLQATIGTAFLPILGSAISTLTPFVQWLGQNKGVLVALGAVIGVALVAAFAAWAKSIILTNIALLANPVTWIILAIVALVGAIVWVATQTTFFQDAWSAATSAIGAAWNWLWGTILKPVFDAIGAAWNWLYNTIIMPIVTGIMVYIGIWAGVITWLWDKAVKPVFDKIGEIFSWVWDSIISPVVDWISDKVTVLGTGFSILWSNYISPALNAIGNALNWVWNAIISPVFNAISNAVTWVGDTIRSAFDGVADFIGNAFNAALDVVRGPINGIIGLVNNAIDGLNKLSVDIPSWVPIVGGQKWGLSIPKIPMLADGGVVTAPTLAMIGEGRGPEAVIPLDRADEFGLGGSGGVSLADLQRLAAQIAAESQRLARGEVARVARNVGSGVRLA